MHTIHRSHEKTNITTEVMNRLFPGYYPVLMLSKSFSLRVAPGSPDY
jgi:hypothetical protein